MKSLAGIGDAPDGARAVVGDEQRAVIAHSDADRAAPDLAVGGDEASQKILILAGGMAVSQRHAHHLIARAALAVPGAVLSGEDGAAIFLGEGAVLLVGHCLSG